MVSNMHDSRRSKIHLIGIPAAEERKNAKIVFEELMARNFQY